MTGKTPPGEMTDIEVTFISYVGVPSNQRKFFLTKSADQPNWQKEVKILVEKNIANNPRKLVYGVVYEPNKKDTYDNYASAETIERAAHQFLERYRQIDEDHNFIPGVGVVVESYIAPQDFVINGETIKKGSWVLVTRASDEVWEKIQKGEYQGYSMAGKANIKVEAKNEDLNLFKKFLKWFRVKKDFDAEMRRDGIMAMTYQFETALRKILEDNGDIDAINESIEQYKTAINNYLSNQPIQKEEEDMDAQALRTILKEEIAKAMAPLLETEKPVTVFPEAHEHLEKLQADYKAIKEELALLKEEIAKSAQKEFNPQKENKASFL